VKILETIWITTNNGCIGIVLGEDDFTKEHKAYIGVVGGSNEEADTKYISRLGSPFPAATAERLYKFLGKKKEGPK
jgi:hypothetical protein